MTSVTGRILVNRTGGELCEISERILQHLDPEGDGTPEITPDIEDPLDILLKVDDRKRKINFFFRETDRAQHQKSLLKERKLLEGFPNGKGMIVKFIWIHNEKTGDFLEDSRTTCGYYGKTYILAQLKNGNFIYLVASMSGVLSEYYGTEEGDWQFGYLFVSSSREELIEKSMTDEEYDLYISTTSTA